MGGSASGTGDVKERSAWRIPHRAFLSGPRWDEAMRDDSIPEELLVAAAQDALRDLNRMPDDRTALDTLVA
jgi:hypothetical protein